MGYEFRWNGWNLDHVAKHGVSAEQAEFLVRRGPRRRIGDGKYLVIGRDHHQRMVQVIYIIDPEQTLYIIHARPLTRQEKHRERKRRP